MVIPHRHSLKRPPLNRGLLSTELAVATAVLASALIPISFQFVMETKAIRRAYQEAVIMQVIDGEMEILMAGGWKNLASGRHQIQPIANALGSIPTGEFWVDRREKQVSLQWLPPNGTRLKAQVRTAGLP